jgi:hypothetical protein
MGRIGDYGTKNGKNLVFNDFWPFLAMDEWFSWPNGLLDWVNSLGCTMG